MKFPSKLIFRVIISLCACVSSFADDLLNDAAHIGELVTTINSDQNDYIKDIEALLSSVDLIKRETNVQQTAAKGNAAVIGTWGIGTTIASSYNMRITEGSIITQYIFRCFVLF